MRTLAVVIFVMSFTSIVHAENLKDNLIAMSYGKLEGSRSGSLDGGSSYGLIYQSYTSLNWLRGFAGGQFEYSNSSAMINSTSYTSTLYSGDLLLGVSLYSFSKSALSPIFELAGMAGFKSLRLPSPPTGESHVQSALSYGYKASIGLDLSLSTKKSVRLSVDYIRRTSSDLFSQKFEFNSIAFNLGILF